MDYEIRCMEPNEWPLLEDFLYDASNKHPGFEYPFGLGKIVDLGIVDMDTWFIMDAPFAEGYCADMAERYPDRRLVPFAKRCDNDDVACFEVGKPGRVEVIRDFADPGWEQTCEIVYRSFLLTGTISL